MTIAAAGDTLAPADRALTIYPSERRLLPFAHIG